MCAYRGGNATADGYASIEIGFCEHLGIHHGTAENAQSKLQAGNLYHCLVERSDFEARLKSYQVNLERSASLNIRARKGNRTYICTAFEVDVVGETIVKPRKRPNKKATLLSL
jgi:hypothetical protein